MKTRRQIRLAIEYFSKHPEAKCDPVDLLKWVATDEKTLKEITYAKVK